MPPPALSLIWLFAQASPDTSPTTVLLATVSGFGLCGILAVLYIIDARKRERDNTELVRNFLAQLVPFVADVRDVLRNDTEAHHAATAAAKATTEALERYAHQLPTVEQLARITVYLERLDKR